MKALVIGTVGYESHEESVRLVFLEKVATWDCHIAEIGTGTPAGNIVTYQKSIAACVQYAIDNNYQIIIRSYSGVYSYKLEWEHALEYGIAVFNAHGSNSHIYLSSPAFLMKGTRCIGGGVSVNERSYGPGLDLFSCTVENATEESWATPMVAGYYALLKSAYQTENVYDLWIRLFRSSSFWGTGWIENGGYGKTDNGYSSTLPLHPPLEVVAIKAGDNQSVTFTWKNYLQSAFNSTVIKKSDGTIIYDGTLETYTWHSNVTGSETFSFYTQDASGNLSRLESFAIKIIEGLETICQIGSIYLSSNNKIITIAYDLVDCATSYIIEQYINGNWVAVISPVTVLITGTYSFRYKALNATSETDYSEISTIEITDHIGTVGTIQLTITNDVINVSYSTVTNASAYVVQVDGGDGYISCGQSYTAPAPGTYTFRYKAQYTNVFDELEETSWSATVSAEVDYGTIGNITLRPYHDKIIIDYDEVKYAVDYVTQVYENKTWKNLTSNIYTVPRTDIYKFRYKAIFGESNSSEWSSEVAIHKLTQKTLNTKSTIPGVKVERYDNRQQPATKHTRYYLPGETGSEVIYDFNSSVLSLDFNESFINIDLNTL